MAYTLPQTISGFARKTTKLGLVATTHSQMPEGEVEYWPWPMSGADIPNWPAAAYPMLLYTSTDHGNVGGVYLRVWDRTLGELFTLVNGVPTLNEAALVEWQDVSSRPEFDHITQKTNPIFVDSGKGTQTETPAILIKDGTVHMYYHNSGVSMSDYDGFGNLLYQQTKRVTSSNGVDFSGINTLTGMEFSAYQVEGDSHDGYASVGINTISEQPYSYIGRTLHGGGGIERGATNQLVGSSDGENWEEITTYSSQTGLMSDDPEFGTDRIMNLSHIHNAVREGAYYRVVGHLRDRVSGINSTRGRPVEFLIDGNLNTVSYPKITVDYGATGEFDEDEVGTLYTVTVEGQEYGFYKSRLLDGTSALGLVLLDEEEYDWNLVGPHSQRTSLFETYTTSGAVAPDLTYSHTPSVRIADGGEGEGRVFTSMVLPSDTTASTAISTSFSVDLSSHDQVDVFFDKIGKNNKLQQYFEFGLIDSLSSSTSKIAYKWPASNGTDGARSEPMRVTTIGANDDSDKYTLNYFGQSGSWIDNDKDESPASKHNVGFRIIPSLNKLVMLEGGAQTQVFDISGFDYTIPLKIFVSNNLTVSQGSDSIFSISDIRVYSYSGDAIAVPDEPTVSATATGTSITASASTVSGATGYKYYLDYVEQPSNEFTGLRSGEDYLVHARAYNELGDSAPSNGYTITTQAGNNAPVFVSSNGFISSLPDTEQNVVFNFTDDEALTYVITVEPAGVQNTVTGNSVTLNTGTSTTARDINITCEASDGELSTAAVHTIAVSAYEGVSTAPTPHAGPNQQNIISGGTLTLNGSSTLDPSNVIVNIQWNQTAGTNAIINDPGELISSVTLPTVTVNETMTFELTITDSSGNTYTDSVSFSVLAIAASALRIDSYTIKFKDNKQKVIKGFDNEVFIDFTFANDFTLSEFTVIEVKIGDETYSTIDDPAQVYILENRLVLNIGENTTLEVNKYKPLIIGKNAYYNSGHVFTSPVNPVLSGDLDVIELS